MALPTSATDGKNNFPTNPFPLGLTTVSSAGTAKKLTGNYVDIDNLTATHLTIQALSTNTGLAYVLVEAAAPPWTLPGGGTTSGADTTNYLNVVRILAKGEVWEFSAYMMNTIRLGALYADVVTSGDKVIATANLA
jgi:hypothetical protein